jgi:hypothetical protein
MSGAVDRVGVEYTKAARTETGGAVLPSPQGDDTGRRCGPICAMMAPLVVTASPEDAVCP